MKLSLNKFSFSKQTMTIMMSIMAVVTILSLDAAISQDDSFIAWAADPLWDEFNSNELYFNPSGTGDGVGIGVSNPAATLDSRGYNYLTDFDGEYTSTLPDGFENAFVTGKKVVLRGGSPQGWDEYMVIDTAGTGDICIGKPC